MTETSAAEAGPTLRSARGDDLPALIRLARAFYDEDGFATSDAELDRNFRELLADTTDARICLAADGDTAVGFALTTSRVILESGVVAELQDLYVVPEYRHQGVATRLIHDSARWAALREAALLEVVIAPNGRDVEHLLGFYAAQGFRDEGRRLLALPVPDEPITPT